MEFLQGTNLITATIIGSIMVPAVLQFIKLFKTIFERLVRKLTIWLVVNQEENWNGYYAMATFCNKYQVWKTELRAIDPGSINSNKTNAMFTSSGVGIIKYQGKYFVFSMYTEDYGLSKKPVIGIYRFGLPSTVEALFASIYTEAMSCYLRPPTNLIAMQYPSGRVLVPNRPISTLAHGHKILNVFDRLRSFVTQEPLYNKLGITYKCNILLYGLPGTGKSSLAKAIATEFNLPIYIMSASYSKEQTLEVINQCKVDPGRFILLIEDVDAHQFSVNRDQHSQEGFSLSSFLNLLDGVDTPHGMIAILTTNHIDSLDDALIRPGRIDIKFEVPLVTEKEASVWASNNGLQLPVTSWPIAGSSLSAAILASYNNPDNR